MRAYGHKIGSGLGTPHNWVTKEYKTLVNLYKYDMKGRKYPVEYQVFFN